MIKRKDQRTAKPRSASKTRSKVKRAKATAHNTRARSKQAAVNGFNGVLVSDLYAAYDSVPCAQKKCLIHLMRDINEDLYKNPFDEDLKEIAGRFGVLLRGIVETIDSYGLKARNLSKHKKAALGFAEHVVAMKCEAEAGSALQKRIETPPCHERLGDHLHYTFAGFNFPPTFLDLLLELGVSRIMFSVDYPWGSMAKARAFLEQIPVSAADRARIAHGNAEKLFRL